MFLEMEGGLGLSLRWRALQPSRSSFFEATTRFSRQIFGRESAFIRPNEVTNTGKRTGDSEEDSGLMRCREFHEDDERGGTEYA